MKALLAGFLSVSLSTCAADPEDFWADPLSVRPPDSPNWALSIPDGVESVAAPTRSTAIYRATPERLIVVFDDVALSDERVERIETRSTDPLTATYRQRSATLGFPDYVSVRAVEIEPGLASLAVYSRSIYGYSDLGVNKERLDRWLDAVEETITER